MGKRKSGFARYLLASMVIVMVVSLLSPGAARAEVSFIPVPVYATTRNGGNDYGVMPVWLFKEQNEYVYGILAPSVIYNDNTGVNITFRYLGYPSVDRNYKFFVNRSTGVDQEYTAEYMDNQLWGGKFRLYAKGSFYRDSTFRFFGLTEKSRENDETNYSNVEVSPEFTLGYYLPNDFIVSYGEKVRWVWIRKGTADNLPYIKDRFADVEGINGGAVWERTLKLSYDTRNDEVYPAEGWYANMYGSLGHSLTKGRLFTRGGLDVRKYFSFDDQRYTTVLKGAVQVTGGEKVPFFAQSTLGGENTLRGFGNYRFRDDAFIVLNIEERIRMFKLHIFGVWSDWEAAPFIDIGRVYSSFDNDFFRHYQVNPGIGFRAIVKPNVVGRVDFGYGDEGVTAFVGLDFPF